MLLTDWSSSLSIVWGLWTLLFMDIGIVTQTFSSGKEDYFDKKPMSLTI